MGDDILMRLHRARTLTVAVQIYLSGLQTCSVDEGNYVDFYVMIASLLDDLADKSLDKSSEKRSFRMGGGRGRKQQKPSTIE